MAAILITTARSRGRAGNGWMRIEIPPLTEQNNRHGGDYPQENIRTSPLRRYVERLHMSGIRFMFNLIPICSDVVAPIQCRKSTRTGDENSKSLMVTTSFPASTP